MTDEGAHKNDAAEILHERLRMLEEEKQRLKKEIENQQAVVEMLITNDKCTDKSKNNTNIASPGSVSPKNS